MQSLSGSYTLPKSITQRSERRLDDSTKGYIGTMVDCPQMSNIYKRSKIKHTIAHVVPQVVETMETQSVFEMIQINVGIH